MNAPLNVNSVEKRLLLAAIDELTALYDRKKDACVALLISRNYQLLSQQLLDVNFRLASVEKAKFWRQQYVQHSASKYIDVDFLAQNDSVFKPIAFNGIEA